MDKLIKNSDNLSTSAGRKTILELIETGLESIEPQRVLSHNFSLDGTALHISNETYDLAHFDRVFLIGFGKGAAGIAKFIEDALDERLTDGYVIDTVEQVFAKVHFTMGTHPLPSQQNIDFTRNVLEKMDGISERDLVLVVICGGGSAMFEAPYRLNLETLDVVFDG